MFMRAERARSGTLAKGELSLLSPSARHIGLEREKMAIEKVYGFVSMTMGGIGISLNLALIIVVYFAWRRDKDSKMNLFVVLKAFADICFATIALMSSFGTILERGLMIMPTFGLSKYLPHPMDYLFLDIGITFGCNLQMSPLPVIIYRYIILVKRENLSQRQILALFIGMMAFGIAVTRFKMITYYVHLDLTAEQNASIVARLVEFKTYGDPNFDMTRYFLASTGNIFHRVGVSGVFLVAGACGVVTVFCSYFTFASLNATKSSMSPATLIMHRRVQKVLLTQSALPIVFSATPMTIMEGCYYLQMSWPLWASTLFNWCLFILPVLNPIVVFILTPSYLRVFYRPKPVTAPSSTTAFIAANGGLNTTNTSLYEEKSAREEKTG